MLKKSLSIFIFIFLTSSCFAQDKSLFLGIAITQNDALIPAFLNTLEELQYDKKLIKAKIYVLNENPEVYEKVLKWSDLFRDKFASLVVEKSALSLPKVKNAFLQESYGSSDYAFILTSEVFVKPFTLQTLIEKNLPLVAPLLRPVPQLNSPYRNFFLAATETGYYKEHPDYPDVLERKNLGTFQADCIHGAYLIQTKYNRLLSFEEGSSPWDFINFSNFARTNKVPQYICNEREFGFFLHQDPPQKDLNIPFLQVKINREKVKEIVSKQKPSDHLQHYLETFPIQLYTIFPVGNDLYWVDEKWDWVKSHYIKKGLKWEPHIEKLFREYVKEGDTVIDIGGHIGTHTITLSQIVGPKGTVHVFEPQAKLFTELLVNTALNNCANVQAYNVALGAEEKEMEIVHPCGTNEGMATIGIGGEKVAMKKLDNFHINQAKLLKIDIEGYEIEALKGALNTIKESKPVIIVEIFKNGEYEEKMNFIRNLGYQVTHLEDNDYLCLPLAS